MIRLFFLAAVVVAAASSPSQASIIRATASLDYAQEVSPSNLVPSSSTGTATVLFDTTTNLLDISAEIEGIFLADITFPSGALMFGNAGPFHIHMAPRGANGPIQVPFPEESFFTETATGLEINATGISFDPLLIDALNDGNLYLNLHTLDYTSGEIRGQLSTVPEPASLIAWSAVGLVGLGFVGLRRQRRNRLS